MARVIKLTYYNRAVRAFAEDQYGYNLLYKYCREHLYLTATTVVNGQIVDDPDNCEMFFIDIPRAFGVIVELSHAEQLKASVEREGFTVVESTREPVPGTKASFHNHTLTLYEPEGSKFSWQNDGIVAICENDHNIFELQTGKGKCLHNDTLIRIPGGWRAIGDILVGDKVIGADGKEANVTGVYPNGVVNLYNVTFSDGRTVKACGEHLWKSFYINTTVDNRWGIRDTLELKRLIGLPNPRVYIPLPEPENTPVQDLPVHPYLLGVLLGDGYLGKDTIGITKSDIELINRVESVLPKCTKLAGGQDGMSWLSLIHI